MTRDELARELGCSAGAIVQWERGTRSIPAWVEEKMLRNVPLTLPISDLSALIDHANATGHDFSDVLAEAIRDYLRRRRDPHKAAIYDLGNSLPPAGGPADDAGPDALGLVAEKP